MSVPKPRKTLFETDLAERSHLDIEGVGVLREDDKGNVYRWVKNLTPSAMPINTWCSYPAADFSASSALALTRVQLNMGPDATGVTLAGVVIASAGLGVSSVSCFGWIQVRGFNSGAGFLIASATAIGIGDALYPASASASATLLTVAGSPPDKGKYAIALKVRASVSECGVSMAMPVRIYCL